MKLIEKLSQKSSFREGSWNLITFFNAISVALINSNLIRINFVACGETCAANRSLPFRIGKAKRDGIFHRVHKNYFDFAFLRATFSLFLYFLHRNFLIVII